MMKQRTRLFAGLLLTLALLPVPGAGAAEEQTPIEQTLEVATAGQYQAELPVLQRVEKVTKVPWYYLAAVNQYEMGIHWKKNKDNPNKSGIQIEFPPRNGAGRSIRKEKTTTP
ncbi:hypothetical protein [Tumebacillus avium]|uniref:hypothetical protein n=1 Tax=Tumebacillus avium TaxID=1903704 RepID=UPI001E357EDA|nr:hypothetical protein [Tumebacillus avium]